MAFQVVEVDAGSGLDASLLIGAVVVGLGGSDAVSALYSCFTVVSLTGEDLATRVVIGVEVVEEELDEAIVESFRLRLRMFLTSTVTRAVRIPISELSYSRREK